MSFRCVNLSCFQGDLGNPPEYESDNLTECAECGQEIDADDTFAASDGSYYCEDCHTLRDEPDDEDLEDNDGE